MANPDDAFVISKWAERFENNRTRAMAKMRWVPVPNSFDGDGYTQLCEYDNFAEIYGCWILMLEVASRCWPRGKLIRKNGQPHTAKSLGRLTRVPQTSFDRAIPALLLAGWLEKAKSSPRTLNPPTPQGVRGDIGAEGAESRQEGAESRQEGAESRQEGAEIAQASSPRTLNPPIPQGVRGDIGAEGAESRQEGAGSRQEGAESRQEGVTEGRKERNGNERNGKERNKKKPPQKNRTSKTPHPKIQVKPFSVAPCATGVEDFDSLAKPDASKQSGAAPPRQTKSNRSPWGLWTEAHILACNCPPPRLAPDMRAAKAVAKALPAAGNGAAPYNVLRECFRRYLADQDSWLIKHGHALRHMQTRLGAYLIATATAARNRRAEEKNAPDAAKTKAIKKHINAAIDWWIKDLRKQGKHEEADEYAAENEKLKADSNAI